MRSIKKPSGKPCAGAPPPCACSATMTESESKRLDAEGGRAFILLVTSRQLPSPATVRSLPIAVIAHGIGGYTSRRIGGSQTTR